MKKGKIRFFIVLAVFLSILFLIPSCRKNEGEGSSSSFISSLLSFTRRSEREPVVTVPGPESSRKDTASDDSGKTERTADSAVSDVTAEKSESGRKEVKEEQKTEETSTPGTLRVPSAPVFSLVKSEITDIPEMTEVYEDVFSYKGVSLDVRAYPDSAVIMLGDGITERDIENVASLVLSHDPLYGCVSYRVNGKSVALTYPESGTEEVADAFRLLFSASMEYIDSLESGIEVIADKDEKEELKVSFTVFGDARCVLTYDGDTLTVTSSRSLTEEEFSYCTALVVENVPSFSSLYYKLDSTSVSFSFNDGQRLEEKDEEKILSLLDKYADSVVIESGLKTERSEEEVVVALPSEEKTVRVAEAERKIRSFSLYLLDNASYDRKNSLLYNSFNASLFYSFSPTLSLGIKAGYDMGKYALLSAAVRYSFNDLFYVFGGAGYRFGFEENKEKSSVICEAGIGTEIEIGKSFRLILEGGALINPNGYNSFVMPYVSAGFGVKF